jgi:hypothetical protein
MQKKLMISPFQALKPGNFNTGFNSGNRLQHRSQQVSTEVSTGFNTGFKRFQYRFQQVKQVSIDFNVHGPTTAVIMVRNTSNSYGSSSGAEPATAAAAAAIIEAAVAVAAIFWRRWRSRLPRAAAPAARVTRYDPVILSTR